MTTRPTLTNNNQPADPKSGLKQPASCRAKSETPHITNPLSGNTLNPALINSGINTETGDVAIGNVGAWSLGIHGSWKMSPKMSFSAELGYFQANEPRIGQDDSLGVEIGVGMGYKIYNNLSYNAHFSYLATGDFFKSNASGLSSAGSTEDVYLVAHALSMKF
jgi:hypothetical protein